MSPSFEQSPENKTGSSRSSDQASSHSIKITIKPASTRIEDHSSFLDNVGEIPTDVLGKIISTLNILTPRLPEESTTQLLPTNKDFVLDFLRHNRNHQALKARYEHVLQWHKQSRELRLDSDQKKSVSGIDPHDQNRSMPSIGFSASVHKLFDDIYDLAQKLLQLLFYHQRYITPHCRHETHIKTFSQTLGITLQLLKPHLIIHTKRVERIRFLDELQGLIDKMHWILRHFPQLILEFMLTGTKNLWARVKLEGSWEDLSMSCGLAQKAVIRYWRSLIITEVLGLRYMANTNPNLEIYVDRFVQLLHEESDPYINLLRQNQFVEDIVERRFNGFVAAWKEIIEKMHGKPAKKMEDIEYGEDSITKPRMILDRGEWRDTPVECTCDQRWNIWTDN